MHGPAERSKNPRGAICVGEVPGEFSWSWLDLDLLLRRRQRCLPLGRASLSRGGELDSGRGSGSEPGVEPTGATVRGGNGRPPSPIQRPGAEYFLRFVDVEAT